MYRWVRERHMIGIRGRNFMEAPWAGGNVLLGCVIIAMLLANLPATSLYYRHLLETDLSLMVHSPDGLIDWVFPRGMTVEKLINDGLMVIFFFAVGLEIKREIVCGQLSSAKKALLPVLASEPFWSSRSSTAGRCRSDVCWRRWSSCSASTS